MNCHRPRTEEFAVFPAAASDPVWEERSLAVCFLASRVIAWDTIIVVQDGEFSNRVHLPVRWVIINSRRGHLRCPPVGVFIARTAPGIFSLWSIRANLPVSSLPWDSNLAPLFYDYSDAFDRIERHLFVLM